MRLEQGDCLELMKTVADKSLDMILCDLPYGTTACKWDTIIPFEPLWAQYKRIIKDNGAIVLTASQPFTSALVMSNVDMFRYDLVWTKTQATGFYNANRMPLRAHEDILVFYKTLPKYFPQKSVGKPYKIKRGSASDVYVGKDLCVTDNVNGERHPLSYFTFTKDKDKSHPTQKPVALFEYMIKTYTNEGDLVMDNCMGSGTTGVACKKLKRDFIGFELDPTYFEIAKKRIEEAQ